MQVYGGYGFIKDYPEIQRLVIARETLLPRAPEQAPRTELPAAA